MITVTLTDYEILERARSLAQYANKLAELSDEEEGAKARHKQLMADIKERRLDISNELRRLSRAVRLGVEERHTQQVLFDEEKRLEEYRRTAREQADQRIAEGEEMIEQQQAETEAEASREAVAEFFEGKEEAEQEGEGIYTCEGCGAFVQTDLTPTDGLCSRCWTPDAIRDPEERAAFLAENADGEGALGEVINLDDYTAERCDECKGIDGAHAQECSKSNALTHDDYLAWATAQGLKYPESIARKLVLTRTKDAEVRAWKEQQQAGAWKAEVEEIEQEIKDNMPDPAKKTRKRAKLSPVEAAIDR